MQYTFSLLIPLPWHPAKATRSRSFIMQVIPLHRFLPCEHARWQPPTTVRGDESVAARTGSQWRHINNPPQQVHWDKASKIYILACPKKVKCTWKGLPSKTLWAWKNWTRSMNLCYSIDICWMITNYKSNCRAGMVPEPKLPSKCTVTIFSALVGKACNMWHLQITVGLSRLLDDYRFASAPAPACPSLTKIPIWHTLASCHLTLLCWASVGSLDKINEVHTNIYQPISLLLFHLSLLPTK